MSYKVKEMIEEILTSSSPKAIEVLIEKWSAFTPGSLTA